uniref:4-amino-4-deoxy-L-arabinose transferase n=1 Tax=Candidatus Kentrum sp. UNK TaxID=2126344 RepID=A0A451AY67_9GAMM|nr:MAG: hypothetical protein BECKUNK1418H_GA0071006_10463 [Candidatus Kentron sp. UNK]
MTSDKDSPLLPSHLTPSGLATLFTLVTILISWGILYLPWQSAVPWERYLPELISAYDMHDSAGQRMAHRVALGMIALFSLLGAYLGWKNRLHFHGKVARGVAWGFGYLRAYAWIGIVLVVILTAMEVARGETTLLAMIKAPRPTYLAAGILILWFLPTITDRIPPWTQRLLWAVFLLYCLYLLLPSLIVTPSYARMDPEWFSELTRHYSAVIYPTLSSEQEGIRPLKDLLPSYGVLFPVLATMGQQLWGALSFGDFIHIIQLIQIAFFLMMVAAHRVLLGGRSLALVGVIFLILPWLGSFNLAVMLPNLSAWRFLGIAIVPLLLVSIRHFSMRRAAIILGFGSGIVLLINLETGLCLSAGMLAYLTARMNPFSWGRFARLLVLFAVGFLALAGFCALFFRIGLGYWPPIPAAGTLFGPIIGFSSGFGGLPFHWDPLAIVIFTHATFIVIRSAMTWRMRTLPFQAAFKLAIAIIILSWLAYYVNRPATVNLWTHTVLYLFLIPGYVNLERLIHWKRQWKFRRWRATPIAAAVLILILMPTALRTNLHAINRVSRGLSESLQTPTMGIEKVSDVWLAQDLARRLREKGAYVRAIAPSGEFLMFTPHAYMVSLLSGHVPTFPAGNFFFSITRREHMDGFIQGVLARAPKRLLFDADILYPDDSEEDRKKRYAFNKRFLFEQQAVLRRLQNRLRNHYHATTVVSGWEIWERRDP